MVLFEKGLFVKDLLYISEHEGIVALLEDDRVMPVTYYHAQTLYCQLRNNGRGFILAIDRLPKGFPMLLSEFKEQYKLGRLSSFLND